MTVKRIIASIVTLIVGMAALGLSYTIFKNVAPTVAEPAPTAETEKTRNLSNSTASNVGEDLPEVAVVKVKNQSISSDFSAQGRLRAYDKVDLVAEIPGMIKPNSKRFKVGTRYTTGEMIFTVDDAEARLALQAQKAQLHTAITQMMPDLKIDMSNSFPQWKNYLDQLDVNRSLSPLPKALSDQEAYYVSLKGVQAQYYNIKSAELRLTKYQVKAPFDGIITTALVGDTGYLRAGGSLGTIMNTSLYELETAVQVADLKYIKQGRSVKVVSEDSGKSWTGTVKRIGNLVDPNTQTATVYIGLSGSGLREGQYLKAMIKGNSSQQVATIPKNLLVGMDKVYIIKNGKVELASIEIIRNEGENILVKGLNNDALLVLSPSASSLEGQEVQPKF